MTRIARLVAAYARLVLVLLRLVARPPVFVLTCGGVSSPVALRRSTAVRFAFMAMRYALALPFARFAR